jgi:uncharacterized protein YjcR
MTVGKIQIFFLNMIITEIQILKNMTFRKRQIFKRNDIYTTHLYEVGPM